MEQVTDYLFELLYCIFQFCRLGGYIYIQRDACSL